MTTNESKFHSIVKARSNENTRGFDLLYDAKLYGKCMSTLREELDSYIRILFLRNHPNKNLFIQQTLNGELWKDGKQKITDRYMLDYLKDKEIDCWERKYIYEMGCFFIHLSKFHNYKNENPFDVLSEQDRANIVKFIKDKHSYEMDATNLDINNIETIIPFLPLIMKKISTNLLYSISKI
jgi:hypothetical protein